MATDTLNFFGFPEEPLTRYEKKHQYCFSSPDCEDFPTGCHHYSREMGIEVEEFGHKDKKEWIK